MATGINTTNTFSDSMDDIRAAARTRREYDTVMGRIVDTVRLPENSGINWREVILEKLTATGIDEITDLEQNPQEVVDALFSLAPTIVGLSVMYTDRAKLKMSKEVAAKLGVLTENAMLRKSDVDMIAAGQAATTDLGTAGNPFSSDIVSAGVSIVRGNTTEPWDGPVAVVARTFQIKDLQDEAVGGYGTYPTYPGSIAEKTLRSGFNGDLYTASVNADDNMSVDGSDDSIAFIVASGPNSAIVRVTDEVARRITVRRENIGTGAEILFCTDSYGLGIRQQAWIRAATADSATPTA